MSDPTDDELKMMIRNLVPKVDLQKTGIKSFIKLLSQEYDGMDLKHRSDFIKEALSEAINDLEGDDEEGVGGDPTTATKPKTAKAKAVTATAAKKGGKKKAEAAIPPPEKKKRKAGKGLSIKKEISPQLAKLLGQGNEMSRTEIVKALWDYIKEHKLQNAENKREILLDENMQLVFGVPSFTMFTMNKYIASHVHPFPELDLTEKPKTSPKKRKRKKEEVSVKKKRKPKKPGLQPPYRLSADMAKVVGKDILPRPQVVTALWDYIKKNNLQVRSSPLQILLRQIKSCLTHTHTHRHRPSFFFVGGWNPL